MYLYHLSYSWYEDYSSFILTHAHAFTAEEWKTLLQQAHDETIPKLLQPDQEGYCHWVGANDILGAVVEWLLQHDFQYATCQQSHSSWGGNMFLQEDLKKLQGYTPEEGPIEFGEALEFVKPWLERLAAYNQAIEDKDQEEFLAEKAKVTRTDK